MKRQTRRHEGHKALSEQNPDLMDDPADGQQNLEQDGYLMDS
jgi:hypothetical protein